MPWQECCKMDERLRFVARSLEGEKMAVLCREFDISRKTGYKRSRATSAWGAAQPEGYAPTPSMAGARLRQLTLSN